MFDRSNQTVKVLFSIAILFFFSFSAIAGQYDVLYLIGSKPPALEDLRLWDTSNVGYSQFRITLEGEGYTLTQQEAGPGSSFTLTAPYLDGFKVLILSSNNRPFSASEEQVVWDWVNAGGGLVAWSDSAFGRDQDGDGSADNNSITNTVGLTSNNSLTEQFGFFFIRDTGGVFTYDSADQYEFNHYIWQNGVADGVIAFKGEGVSPMIISSPAQFVAKWSEAGGSNPWLRSEDINQFGATMSNTAALAIADVGNGRVVGTMDRNTFWNNGAGTDIDQLDHRQYARNLVTWAAGHDISPCDGDLNPPLPNTAQWQQQPTLNSNTSCTMTAVAAVDPEDNDVQYNFIETTGNLGGNDSGWQASATYTDTGLASCTKYTYIVRTRDNCQNTGGDSAEVTVATRCSTDIDNDGITNLVDLSVVSLQWLNTGCLDVSYMFCDGADFDANGTVDMDDLETLAANWLELSGPPIITLEYSPTDDAYLQGTARYNTVDLRTEEGNRITYIKFVVSDVPGGAYSVSSAVLTITEGNDVGNGTFTCYSGTATDWTEATLSGANAPVQIAQLDQYVGGVINGQAVDFDVSPYVASDGVYHFIITHASGNDVSWQSKENSAGAGPLLTVTAER